MNKLEKLLGSEETILLDGAMGTILMQEGLTSGDPPEEWNSLYPERIRAIHQHYIDAGSRIVLTNSFGGSRYRLKLHNLQDRVYELNKAAAEIAAEAAAAAPNLVLVAGSIGPTGELLSPMGDMEFNDAVSAFAEQAQGLTDGGVDVLWIETMSDLEEVRAAVEGTRSVTDRPIFATMSFDTNGRTMMGVTPAKAVTTLSQWGLAAIGGNCGNGIEEIERVIYEMHLAAPDTLLIAKSNAGIPQWANNELVYDAQPPDMGDYGQRVKALGATFIGGCCGNTPDHIQAIRTALSQPITDQNLATVDQYREGITLDNTTVDPVPRRRRRRRSG